MDMGMSSDVNSSAGNTSSGGAQQVNPFVTPEGLTQSGNVSGVVKPPSEQLGVDNLGIQEVVTQTFDEQGKAQTAESANPKLLQPEVNQAILSSSDAFKFILMNNLIQLNNSGDAPKNLELMSKLYGMDESMLHRMSEDGFDFSTTQDINTLFSNKINEIISNSWDKFNEVIDELNKRDQEWLRSSAKQYLDLVKSSEYHFESGWKEASPAEKSKINQSAAEFESFLDSMPAGDKERFLAQYQTTGVVGADASRYLMSENVKAFGNAFRETTPTELNSNNSNILLTTVMTNAGGIMSHQSYALPINPEQVNVNLIRDGMTATANNIPIIGFDSNTAATLGYLGAMLASSAMLLSSFENVAATKGQGRPVNDSSDVDFAKRYAYNLSTFVNSKGFEAGVTAIITQRSDSTVPLNQDQKTEIVARLRVIMLSNAFAMVHNANPQNEKMTGADWRNAVEHPEVLANNPVNGVEAYALARDIQTYVKSIKDPVARANLMDSLEEFFNAAPTKKELLETNNAIKGAFVDEQPRGIISDR